MSPLPLIELMKFAIYIAKQAGDLTLKYYQSTLIPELKADQSPVTRADRESELLMRNLITERYPDHAIIGEEFGEITGKDEYRWILDPIDGTLSFISGVSQYGIIVGVEFKREIVVGVVHLPVLNETIAAARGEGCFWNQQLCHVSTTRKLEDALLLSTDDQKMRRVLPGYALLADRTRMVRTWGDCLGAVLVATGRADIWLDNDLDVTDIGALLPIIEEAGGKITNWHGVRTAWTDSVLVTNGILHSETLRLITS